MARFDSQPAPCPGALWQGFLINARRCPLLMICLLNRPIFLCRLQVLPGTSTQQQGLGQRRRCLRAMVLPFLCGAKKRGTEVPREA